MNIAMEQTDELVNGKVTNSFGGEQRVFRSAAALSLFSDAFIRGNNGARGVAAPSPAEMCASAVHFTIKLGPKTAIRPCGPPCALTASAATGDPWYRPVACVGQRTSQLRKTLQAQCRVGLCPVAMMSRRVSFIRSRHHRLPSAEIDQRRSDA
jgi:hypothetical protein